MRPDLNEMIRRENKIRPDLNEMSRRENSTTS